MAKSKESSRTPRQRRRYRARSTTDYLRRNGSASPAGRANTFEGAFQCHYCDRYFTEKRITKDHIWPRALGGLDEDWNWIPSCKPCNQNKGSNVPTCSCDSCSYAIQMHKKIKLAQGFSVLVEDID